MYQPTYCNPNQSDTEQPKHYFISIYDLELEYAVDFFYSRHFDVLKQEKLRYIYSNPYSI